MALIRSKHKIFDAFAMVRPFRFNAHFELKKLLYPVKQWIVREHNQDAKSPDKENGNVKI